MKTSEQMCRAFASCARTLHTLSIRCEKDAVQYPRHAEQLLEEARYKRRASWRYLEFAREEKEYV